METKTNQNMILVIIGLLAIIFALITLFWNNFLKQPISPPIGLPPQKIPDDCAVQTCHGLDVLCGSGPAKMCTEMYQLGDTCLQFAQCGVINGTCQPIENTEFATCKMCALQCQANFPNNPEQALACENNCGKTDRMDPIEMPPYTPNPVPAPPYTKKPVEEPSDPVEIPPHAL